ncbi:hypothetical protein RF11_05407 [Thelohanellus kitauei]|uniref:Uncharacterized protein n=1 Tax=Thelohanellus kitauei TaxID=669202 RepID=A0A0C2JZ86_THEKT|nr:hypothetical protein RF11_05407 [Thelohanellus kitauei]
MNPNLSNFKLDAFVELKETVTRASNREDLTKVLIFLHSAGPEVNNILTTHSHLKDLEEIPFFEILSCSELHYEPKRPLLLRRIDFQNRKRQPAKKIDECIRDQLIFGIENDTFKQEFVKLCESNKTTLTEVLNLALFLKSTSPKNDDQSG